MITGPQSPSVLSNMPVSIEQHVEWITECIAHMGRNKLATIEATPQAQDAWGAHVAEVVNATLMPVANSWYMGANIAGKARRFLPYLGPEGVAGYRRKCAEVADKGYEGFAFASQVKAEPRTQLRPNKLNEPRQETGTRGLRPRTESDRGMMERKNAR